MFACSVQIISGLDNQCKFQMFMLFSGRHIGVPQRDSNMAAPYWALYICAEYFDEYLKFGITHRPKTWRSVFFMYLL